MDVKEAQNLLVNSKTLAKNLKKIVKKLERKITKAASQGRHTLRFFVGGRYEEIINKYLQELGFKTHMWGDGDIDVFWKPPNFEQIMMPRTEDSKLKHLVITGQTPKVEI